jgi:hypothetical protein
MHHILLSSVACPALPYFSTLFYKQHDFQKNVIEHKICVLVFPTTFVWNISHPKKNSVRYHHKCTNVFMYSTHYSRHILMKLEFSWQIFKKILVWTFMKICAVRAKSFHVDEQMDGHAHMKKLIIAFCSFVNTPKNEISESWLFSEDTKFKWIPSRTLTRIFSFLTILHSNYSVSEAVCFFFHLSRTEMLQQNLNLSARFLVILPLLMMKPCHWHN